MTSETNNQGSIVGAGWDLGGLGFIERRYQGCSDDGSGGTTFASEQCWVSDNATISLNGQATELIPTTGNEYRLRDNPGWRVRRLTGAPGGDPSFGSGPTGGPVQDNDGEYWEVTDQSGTRYTFGRGQEPTSGNYTNSVWTLPVWGNAAGEPCYTTTAAWCYQGWRWNLDRIEDANGRVTTVAWTPEFNWYQLNANGLAGVATKYTRGGYPATIGYTKISGLETTVPPAKIEFTPIDRCNGPAPCPPLTTANAASWPDVPVDLVCTGTTCAKKSPSFFSTKFLDSVRTYVNLYNGTANPWSLIDTVAIWHEFPVADANSNPRAWVRYIQRTGLPAVRFDGVNLRNRVDFNIAAGVPEMWMFRVDTVTDELGGRVKVTYSSEDCTAATMPVGNWDINTQRCFPQYYAPAGGTPGFAGFHKYVVTDAVRSDTIAGGQSGGPAQATHYDYGLPAWHHTDDLLTPASQQSWGDWRGYDNVLVTSGIQTAGSVASRTRLLFYRGMNGDKCGVARGSGICAGATKNVTYTEPYSGVSVNDDNWLRGRPLVEHQLHTDGTTIVASSVHSYTVVRTDGTGSHAAKMVAESATRAVTIQTGGFAEQSKVQRTFDGTYGTQLTSLQTDLTGSTPPRCEVWILAAVGASYIVKPQEHYLQPGGCGVSFGQVTLETFAYDGLAKGAAPTAGNVTTHRAVSGSASSADQVTTYTYDPQYHRVATAVDARGGGVSNVYSAAFTFPAAIDATTKLTATTTATTHTVIHPAWGVVTSFRDANNNTTSADYDGLGRLLHLYPANTPSQAGIQYTYYDPAPPAGQPGPGVTQAVIVKQDRIDLVAGSPRWNVTASYLDGLGRTRQTQAASPSGRTIAYTWFDERNQVIRQSAPIYTDTSAPGANWVVPPTSTARDTVFNYDHLGRETLRAEQASGSNLLTTSTTYNGGRLKTVFPPSSASGGWLDYFTDAFGRLTQVNEHTDTTPANTTATRYTYNEADDLTKIVDNNGNTTTYHYDFLHQRVDSTDPDQGFWSFAYDAQGNPTGRGDARNLLLTSAYDLGRRKTAETQGATTLGEWKYDAAGQLGLADKTCQPTCASPKVVVDLGAYNALNQATSKTTAITVGVAGIDGTYAFSYGYNESGQRTSTTYPALNGQPAETIFEVYNSLGLPQTLGHATSGPNVDLVVATGYNNVGQLASRLTPLPSGNATQRLVGYDSLRRLSSQTTQNGQRNVDTLVAGTITNLLTDVYGYDARGNINSVASTGTTGTQQECYGYDYLGRLTRAYTATSTACAAVATAPTTGSNAVYDESYTYDFVGNLTSKTGIGTYAYGAPKPASGCNTSTPATKPHAVSSTTTGWALAYDCNGNIATRTIPAGQPGAGTVTLNWDIHNWLSSVTNSGGTLEANTYDADGQRVIRGTISGGVATNVLYLDGLVEVSRTGTTNTYTRYYRSGTTTVALRKGGTGTTGDTLTWLTAGNQASTQLSITNAAPSVATSQRYKPYGALRGGDQVTVTDRGFVGQSEDGGIGLDYLNARYYDPTLSRFVSVDPMSRIPGVGASTHYVGRPQGANPYSYAGGNPVSTSDPSGLDIGSLEFNGEMATWDVGGEVGSQIGQASIDPIVAEAMEEELQALGKASQEAMIPAVDGAATRAAAGGRPLTPRETEFLSKAIDEGLVGQNAPANHLRSAIAEQATASDAAEAGEFILRGPTKVTANGPDLVTYDPGTGRVRFYSSKASIRGRYPVENQAKLLERWKAYAYDSLKEYNGRNGGAIRNAIDSGLIDFQNTRLDFRVLSGPV